MEFILSCGLLLGVPLFVGWRARTSKIARLLLVLWTAGTTAGAVFIHRSMADLREELEQEVVYPLRTDLLGRHLLTVAPLREERVSGMDLVLARREGGTPVTLEALARLKWTTFDIKSGWHAGDDASECEGGLLFGSFHRPIRKPLSLEYEVGEESLELLRGLEVRVQAPSCVPRWMEWSFGSFLAWVAMISAGLGLILQIGWIFERAKPVLPQ